MTSSWRDFVVVPSDFVPQHLEKLHKLCKRYNFTILDGFFLTKEIYGVWPRGSYQYSVVVFLFLLEKLPDIKSSEIYDSLAQVEKLLRKFFSGEITVTNALDRLRIIKEETCEIYSREAAIAEIKAIAEKRQSFVEFAKVFTDTRASQAAELSMQEISSLGECESPADTAPMSEFFTEIERLFQKMKVVDDISLVEALYPFSSLQRVTRGLAILSLPNQELHGKFLQLSTELLEHGKFCLAESDEIKQVSPVLSGALIILYNLLSLKDAISSEVAAGLKLFLDQALECVKSDSLSADFISYADGFLTKLIAESHFAGAAADAADDTTPYIDTLYEDWSKISQEVKITDDRLFSSIVITLSRSSLIAGSVTSLSRSTIGGSSQQGLLPGAIADDESRRSVADGPSPALPSPVPSPTIVELEDDSETSCGCVPSGFWRRLFRKDQTVSLVQERATTPS